jgi:hypothetical protein
MVSEQIWTDVIESEVRKKSGLYLRECVKETTNMNAIRLEAVVEEVAEL